MPQSDPPKECRHCHEVIGPNQQFIRFLKPHPITSETSGGEYDYFHECDGKRCYTASLDLNWQNYLRNQKAQEERTDAA